MATISIQSPDCLFNDKASSRKKKGLRIAETITKDRRHEKEETQQANFKLITTLDGPRKKKEYAKQLTVMLVEDKRPIMQFFALLNLKPYNSKKGLNEPKLVELMKEHPDFCVSLYRFEAFSKDLLHPLHMLCVLSASLETIKLCFKCCNAAIYHDVSATGAPIHYACMFNAAFDVIRWLVKKDKDALEVSNTDANMTPLHIACQYEADSETVAFLTSVCPEAAAMTDKDFMTPLHYASSVKEPDLAVIEDLTEVNAEACVAIDVNGATPLLLAIQTKAETAVVRDLIVSNPDSASIKDAEGSTPLHRAIETRADIKVLKDLIKADKNSLKIPDAEGNLPIHAAVEAAVKDMAVYELLARKYSDGLEQENAAGQTPYELAQKVLRDANIIEFLNPFEEVDE